MAIDTRRQKCILKRILKGWDEMEIIRSLNKDDLKIGFPMITIFDEVEDMIECGWAKEIGTEGD